MSNLKIIKPLGLAGCGIAIIQSVAWIAMGILAILIYFHLWLPEFDIPKTHNDYLQYTFIVYLSKSTDNIANALVLFIFSVLYIIFSGVWIGLSSVFVNHLTKDYSVDLQKTCFAWSVWTLIISALDLILMCLLAVDYSSAMSIFPEAVNAETRFLTTYLILMFGILMSLAARGYVLLVINATIAILLLKISPELSEEKKRQSDDYDSETISAFGSPRKSFEYTKPPSENPSFLRASSMLSSNNNNLPPQPPPKPFHSNGNQEKLAKIGKQGPKSPSYNIPPPKPQQNYIYPNLPRIPSPDYSPPNSPLKSALKNRPQNPFNFTNRY